MRVVGRILRWIVGIVVALILLVAGSIVLDWALGRGRLDPITNITLQGDVPVRAYVARPSTPGKYPAIIMVHEWWGLKQDITEKAQLLADEGYIVIAPDLFRGSTTGWIPRAIWQVITTPTEQIDADLATTLAWMRAQPDIDQQKLGITGFCFGGRASLRFSSATGAFAATALFYGSPEIAVSQLAQINGPVLGIFGGADSSIPLEEVRALDVALGEAGVQRTITVYDGQPHAFVAGVDAIRAGGAPAEAWSQQSRFFAQHLQGRAATGRAPNGSGVVGGFIASAGSWTMPRVLHVWICAPARG